MADSLIHHYVGEGLGKARGLAVADSLMRLGKARNDCSLSSAGFGLLAHFSILTEDQISASLPPCPLLGSQAPFILGTQLHAQKKCEVAAAWFEMSLEHATTPSSKSRALREIASCCLDRDNLICALSSLEQAHAWADNNEAIVDLIIQLAGVQIKLGLHEAALATIEEGFDLDGLALADEKMLRIQRLTAHTAEGDFRAARRDVDWVVSQLTEAGSMNAATFEGLVHWALLQEDPRSFHEVRDLLTSAVHDLNLTELFEPNNPARLLFHPFDADWATFELPDTGDVRWITVKSLYADHMNRQLSAAKTLLAREEGQSGATPNLSRENHGDGWKTAAGLAAGLLLIAGLIYALNQMRRGNVQRSKSLSTGAPEFTKLTTEERAKFLLRLADTQDERDRLKAILDSLQSGQLQQCRLRLDAEVSDRFGLNPRETEALSYFVLGHHGKELAELMGCSLGYLYNLRTALRKKMGIAREVEFSVWYEKMAPKAASSH